MNTPTLETERLILRKFTPNDTKAFFEIMKDKEVNTFLPWFPLTTIKQAEDFLDKQYLDKYKEPIDFRYAIRLKTDNLPIGYVSVSSGESYDFGYGLRKEFWSKGIVTEACKAVVQRLRESDLPYITATHDINNLGSSRVMQKIGMTYCYSYKEQCQPKDILVTFRMYQLNLDGQSDRVYLEYWNKSSVRFIEENV